MFSFLTFDPFAHMLIMTPVRGSLLQTPLPVSLRDSHGPSIAFSCPGPLAPLNLVPGGDNII